MTRLLLPRDLYLLESTRVNVIMETSYEIDSCVRGFHVYKESWNLGLVPCSKPGALLCESFEKCLEPLVAIVGPFSAAYRPIRALSSAV